MFGQKEKLWDDKQFFYNFAIGVKGLYPIAGYLFNYEYF